MNTGVYLLDPLEAWTKSLITHAGTNRDLEKVYLMVIGCVFARMQRCHYYKRTTDRVFWVKFEDSQIALNFEIDAAGLYAYEATANTGRLIRFDRYSLPNFIYNQLATL